MNTQETHRTSMSMNDLFDQYWGNLDGKTDTPPEFQRFILFSPEKPRFQNATAIATELFDLLLQDLDAGYTWIKQFGKTIVGTSHDTKLLEQAKKLVASSINSKGRTGLLGSQVMFTPSELMGKSSGNLRILMVNKPCALEGYVIQVSHLTEELLWKLCQKFEQTGLAGPDALKAAISFAQDQGITYLALSENAFLDIMSESTEFYPRLYGSQVQKDLPKVLGAVSTLPSSSSVPYETIDPPPKQTATLLTSAITMAKRPHMGHVLLWYKQRILAASQRNTQSFIVSNSTGPRVAQMVGFLSQQLKLSPEQTIMQLSQNLIPQSSIEYAYKSREQFQGDTRSIELALELHPDSVLITMQKYLEYILALVGLERHMQVTADTGKSIAKTRELAASMSPEWLKLGFCSVPVQGNIYNLVSSGITSAEGKMIGVVLSIAKQLESQVRFIRVDNSQTDKRACEILHQICEIPSAQVGGLGLMINDQEVHGSTQQYSLLQIEEAIGYLQAPTKKHLENGLLYFVLTEPYESKRKSGEPTLETFYNFETVEDFLNTCKQCIVDAESFITHIKTLTQQARCKIGKETHFSTDKGAAPFLIRKAKSFTQQDPVTQFEKMRKRTFVGSKDDKYLSKDNNPYFDFLNTIITDMPMIETISSADFEVLESSVITCFTNLSFHYE